MDRSRMGVRNDRYLTWNFLECSHECWAAAHNVIVLHLQMMTMIMIVVLVVQPIVEQSICDWNVICSNRMKTVGKAFSERNRSLLKVYKLKPQCQWTNKPNTETYPNHQYKQTLLLSNFHLYTLQSLTNRIEIDHRMVSRLSCTLTIFSSIVLTCS